MDLIMWLELVTAITRLLERLPDLVDNVENLWRTVTQREQPPPILLKKVEEKIEEAKRRCQTNNKSQKG